MYFEIAGTLKQKYLKNALWKQRGENINIYFSFLNIAIETT